MHKYLIFIFTITFFWANEKIFVVCEGNYYSNNGSLWAISEENVYEYLDNPIGNVAQSLYIQENKLYVLINGSSNIQVFDIHEDDLIPTQYIVTNGSGPREMLIHENFLYFTNWNTADVKIINLTTWTIETTIITPGLPEDIILHNGLLYVSIIMNHDWTDGSQIITIDPNINEIIDSFEVGLGPGSLLVHEGEIYVSRTYYDDNWNAYYGTSKIKQNGEVVIVEYGSGNACGGGIYSFQNSVYRIYDGGIAMLDDELNIMPETRLGNYNSWEVYSAEVFGEYIYFGLSDFMDPDEVAVVNTDGEEVASYSVGVLPGDFAVWNNCIADGDTNYDAVINVLDIIIIANIITSYGYDCQADMNADNQLNILDIIILAELILD